ncbi:MAG: ROK family glucokinase [Planctomycetota bacterium]
MKSRAVGIDLGGTNIKGGLVERDGTVLAKKSVRTEAAGGADHVIGRIAGLVDDVIAEGGAAKTDVVGVCVGSPGPLDGETGVIYEAPNLGWYDVPLGEKLAPRVGLPVWIENDANVAAFGEAWVGAGRGLECVILLTLGTGIGGGIVLGGRLWRGVHGTGAELGHMTIDYDGVRCNCGSRGCIEAYASAPAVVRRMREAIDAGGESALRPAFDMGEEVEAKQVYEAAADGDALAREVMEQTGRFLGIAVASYVNIFDPNCVVLHGGMVNAGDMLLEPLVEEMNARSFESCRRGLRVLPSALKGEAGLVGAAGCAFAGVSRYYGCGQRGHP